MLKLAVVAALAVAPSPAVPKTNPAWHFADAPAVNETNIAPSRYPEIVRVDCADSRGSAVKVGPHMLLSVAHVTDNEGCTINDRPFKVIYKSGDFSILQVAETFDRWLTIDCSGFVRGRTYTGIGFARGLPVQTSIDAEAMGHELLGFYRLWGVFTVIPGQSGGAFVDPETRKIVGMINVYQAARGDSGSVELKGTAVCK